MRRTTTTATAAVILLPLVVGTAASPALAADSGDVTVTNTETVQARLSATGAFQGARVYEQLALTGHGTATIANPVSTDGLRNLDGFGGYEVVDGKLVSTLEVDGERRERSLSTYDKDLPLTVEVTYTFDGETVQPGAVIGKAGTLGVHYKVTNTTGKTQDVTYDDGTGTMATASAETVIPMIGQLVTVLPSTFTDVRSDEAGMAGDGRGGTRMQFQMTLFPPIGSATAEFGYTAQVSRAVIPKATLTSMPVSPLEYPSFKGGAASYEAGAQKGVDLTGAGLKLDESVLRLHDGSAQLLAGLLQLRDGAAQLSTGLNESAAPGAAQLAAGAGRLQDGLSQASSSAPQLIAGLNQVDAGLAQVDGGLAKLYGDIGQLPSDPRVKELQAGIAKLRAGIGSTTTPDTLLAGIDQLRQQVGTGAPAALATMAAGVYNPSATEPGAYQKLGCAITVLGHLKNGATTGADACYPGGGRPPIAATVDPTHAFILSSLIAQLTAGQADLADPANLGDPTSAAFYGAAPVADPTLQQGLTYLQGRLANIAGPGLTKIQCGLSSASFAGCDATRPGLLEGLTSVDAGVSLLLATVVTNVQKGVGGPNDTAANGTLRGGVHSLQAGTDKLGAGGGALVDGLRQLNAGAGQLNAGAESLSEGLRTAADGSTELSDGLATAAEGAPKLVDGTQQLSDEGTSQVVVSGQGTAEDFGVKYAVLSAGAERAQTEGMAYGAPDGATGATAYSIEIAGVDGTGASSVGRLILAIVLFAGGIGLATLARRRFV
ncbi:hypothetical protein [Cellulomonas terrae]|uniref:Uncharacterized protein n=1 Tax=Cellulomonas terrae TaxID=311234 RepID=A0A511JI24_9CELL|nr:hypothetical protein [Cellulomonas terrae]GEL97606.1 hypothetical protein CTE05_11530 [Cellulomonas terrae]